MTPNEYQRNAMRTASGISTSCPENLLLQGVMGMSGESGEALDIVKTVMQVNIDKLRARYPMAFDSERSQHREEGDL